MPDPNEPLPPAYLEWIHRHNTLEVIDTALERLDLIRRGISEACGVPAEEMTESERLIFEYVSHTHAQLKAQRDGLAESVRILDVLSDLPVEERSFTRLEQWSLAHGYAAPSDTAPDRVLN